ncbi:glycogen synthase GlgA [Corallincola luteus]|uniref:Glycogen synthase n=1 Tax=Corallincola luteus TaxID=1775177 RepID=A0ABY2AP56_9GAMM|nr:glycogen synthase GlgA [Corallincola luteus]TCI04802.1 glycogen synthase GlgA [Corallincola luteus]
MVSDRKLKILFLATEVEDLAKTGGLADVAKALPQALTRLGHDVRIVCPFYPQVQERLKEDNHLHSELSLQLGNLQYLYNIHQLHLGDVPVYSVDYPPYFSRQGLYDNGYHAYQDNGERFAFFSMAALQITQSLDFAPDIIHCNDWHTAMAPFFLRNELADNQFFYRTRTLLTLHNAAYQGVFDLDSIPFHQRFISALSSDHMEQGNKINFLKCGLLTADKINAVSPSYAAELLTPLGSHHILSLFQHRHRDFSGILNGCNYDDWNPATDSLLPKAYDQHNLAGKAECKAHLQQYVGLPEQADTPLFGMVSRLTGQKGFHLLLPALQRFLEQNVQVVIIGSGEQELADNLRALEAQYPDKLIFREGYTSKIAHWVQAGADYFLMPSLFEPCGLTQMYSLAYGTPPIVRGVGGLKDTVKPVKSNGSIDDATGFVFSHPEPDALLDLLMQALTLFNDAPEAFKQLQQNGMAYRFCWEETAKNYVSLYHEMLLPAA